METSRPTFTFAASTITLWAGSGSKFSCSPPSNDPAPCSSKSVPSQPPSTRLPAKQPKIAHRWLGSPQLDETERVKLPLFVASHRNRTPRRAVPPGGSHQTMLAESVVGMAAAGEGRSALAFGSSCPCAENVGGSHHIQERGALVNSFHLIQGSPPRARRMRCSWLKAGQRARSPSQDGGLARCI